MRWYAIVAATEEHGIGKDGGIPWHIPEDLAMFKKLTTCPGKLTPVIMGRGTYESLPPSVRPLPHRLNIVLTSDPRRVPPHEHVRVVSSLDEALHVGQQECDTTSGYVIGGAQVYRDFFTHPACFAVHLTRVLDPFPCDRFIPDVEQTFDFVTESIRLKSAKTGVHFRHLTYINPDYLHKEATGGTVPSRALSEQAVAHVNSEDGGGASVASTFKSAPPLEERKVSGDHEEHQYLALVQRVLGTGVRRPDRTGTGTLSVFGTRMEYDLSDGHCPVFTTKRVFWRGVVEELLWFVRGATDAKLLSAKKVRIWDANGSREFLDRRGLTDNREGDLGPVYGFQWRHFGAEYEHCDTDYRGKGVDQLSNIVHLLKTNSTSRRMVMSAWNPVDIPKMALPPCHLLCQFYVAEGRLSCQMYQRSADLGLGVPFNVASYSLLTCMIAHVCGLRPGKFIHVMGDTHVYLNHVDALKKQLKRRPKAFPTLRFARKVASIDEFVAEDIVLDGYAPHKGIKMKMAV